MNKLRFTLARIRSRLLVFLTHQLALPLLRYIRRPQVFPYSAEQLKGFPGESLGFTLIQFLENRNLKLLPHYAKHDIKHILLEYDTTDEDEVCLQCFMLGNGHISFPVAATVIYGFVTMSGHWKKFCVAYRRGKQSLPIKNWAWFSLLNEPVQALINKINSHEKI